MRALQNSCLSFGNNDMNKAISLAVAAAIAKDRVDDLNSSTVMATIIDLLGCNVPRGVQDRENSRMKMEINYSNMHS